jgi:hypothetical protein
MEDWWPGSPIVFDDFDVIPVYSGRDLMPAPIFLLRDQDCNHPVITAKQRVMGNLYDP